MAAFDDKLFWLWNRWEDAFPGMKFNKFHGLFCTVCKFVHEYHMMCRVSEESPEGYNATLAKTKRLLNRMPFKNKRVQTITARTQANLKEVVLEPRLVIQSSVTR